MYCQAPRKRANLLPKPCEHFGDNIPHASLYPMQGEPKMFIEVGGPPLQLDDHLKNLLRELGHAINDTVSESDRITGAIAGVRAHGYDIVLKLDATIGLAKRDAAAAEEIAVVRLDRECGVEAGERLGGEPQVAKRDAAIVEGIDIVRIVDGRQTEHWGLFDAAAMLQQMGIMPAPEGAPA